MTWAKQQPCLKSWQGEGKLASSPEPTKLYNSHDKGDWTLVSAWSRRRSLHLAPEVLLPNRYDAVGMLEARDCVSNGKDLGKGNRTKLAQSTTRIRTNATKKGTKVVSNWRLLTERQRHPFAVQIITPERSTACPRPTYYDEVTKPGVA